MKHQLKQESMLSLYRRINISGLIKDLNGKTLFFFNFTFLLYMTFSIECPNLLSPSPFMKPKDTSVLPLL